MIYDVHLPDESKRFLWQIVQIQVEVLDCAASMQTELTRERLQNALTATKLAQQADGITDWVFKHSSTLSGLNEFASYQDSEAKSKLVADMRQDVNWLFEGQVQETLKCAFPIPKKGNPLPGFLEGAKKFLISFYDNLGTGLPSSIFPACNNPYPSYGRDQFFAAFEKANPDQYVCAICDEHRFMTVIRGSYFSDIEHYFPKSVYPHLSCHPYNLIPICKQCNSAHLDKDPLQPCDSSEERRKLGGIFLPYRNEGLLKQGVVKLEWKSASDKINTPELSFQFSYDPDNALRKKVKAFAEVYDIPNRWQERIHQIGDQLWRYIKYYVRIELEEMEGAQSLDPLQFKSELEHLLDYFIEDAGKTPWSYVLIWYLGNLLVEEIEAGILNGNQSDALIDTVCDLLVKNKGRSTNRPFRAKEVVETARTIYQNQITVQKHT